MQCRTCLGDEPHLGRKAERRTASGVARGDDEKITLIWSEEAAREEKKGVGRAEKRSSHWSLDELQQRCGGPAGCDRIQNPGCGPRLRFFEDLFFFHFFFLLPGACPVSVRAAGEGRGGVGPMLAADRRRPGARRRRPGGARLVRGARRRRAALGSARVGSGRGERDQHVIFGGLPPQRFPGLIDPKITVQ